MNRGLSDANLFDITPMDQRKPVLQMEMLGHSFLLYLDMETDKVCVVYKRKDGNYGFDRTHILI